MEYSESHKVSADEEEELMEKRRSYIFPCHFLEEAVRDFFKCLGIETKSQEDKDTDEINPKKITPSTSEATDEVAASTRIKVSARARPGLSTGGGGKIN